MGQFGLATVLGAGVSGLALGLLSSRAIRCALARSLFFLPLNNDAQGGPKSHQPHPGWRPPQNQPAPFDTSADVLTFDPQATESAVLYPLVISSVVPRPIAFISTLSKEGVGNLAPYSYFNAVSHCPPVLAIGHCWSRGRPKDSLQNILDTSELVVSIISEWFVEAANHTCGPYERQVDEMEISGLTPVPSQLVKPPRVGESAINFECRLLHHYDLRNPIGEVTTTVVLAEVVLIHIAQAVTTRTPNSGKVVVDPVKLRPVSRLGGNTFGIQQLLFDIGRPDKEGRYPGTTGFAQSERDKTLGTGSRK